MADQSMPAPSISMAERHTPTSSMIARVGRAKCGVSSVLEPVRCGAGSKRPSTTRVARMMTGIMASR
ncbi:hypothetical protein D3C87_2169500 [compost metagenome]